MWRRLAATTASAGSATTAGWLRRYQANGLDGLKDRSSRPPHFPRVTRGDREERVVAEPLPLRPVKIAMYLARYHDVTISTSAVWRILKRLGMNRLPFAALQTGGRCGGSGMRSNRTT
jgi:transposase